MLRLHIKGRAPDLAAVMAKVEKACVENSATVHRLVLISEATGVEYSAELRQEAKP